MIFAFYDNEKAVERKSHTLQIPNSEQPGREHSISSYRSRLKREKKTKYSRCDE